MANVKLNYKSFGDCSMTLIDVVERKFFCGFFFIEATFGTTIFFVKGEFQLLGNKSVCLRSTFGIS